jgi:Arc/MetJ-type ribon-helix-helix transcriptional regulator
MKAKAQRENRNQIIDIKVHTTTVRIPTELHKEVKAVLEGGAFGNFNELLVAAVQDLLRVRRESAVDQQFAQMAEDENYQKVAINLYNLFENSAVEEHTKAAEQEAAQAAEAVPEEFNRAAFSTALPHLKARG